VGGEAVWVEETARKRRLSRARVAYTWHLTSDDRGFVKCGQPTYTLRQVEANWEDVPVPCGLCEWLADRAQRSAS
jgi:hypothetical protein